MIPRKPKLLLLCYLSLANVSLVASQAEQPATDRPLNQNCLDRPCTYLGECRSRSGTCGDTVAHCNAESTWVPACGGGAGLAKPAATANAAAAATSPPTNRPTMRGSSRESTSTPTTAWELWISNKNQPAADEEKERGGENGQEARKEGGGTSQMTGKEGGEADATAPSDANETDWVGFTPESWGYRGEKEEEKGVLDRIPFMSNNSAMASSQIEVGSLVCAAFAWAFLL
mmetsp:Transcript_5176/g.11243  ORF Transcript_5176/g.11243 Transcript_5176/m.11243 type:complete len:230 (+) Transcript_5176:216-905(+)